MRSRTLAALLLLTAANSVLAAGFEAELVVGGLDNPLYATHAPGDPNGLYIVQQRDGGFAPDINTGTILRHDLITGVTTDFLHIGNLDTDTQGGLHALAFHPDYQPGVPGSKLYLIALETSNQPLISNNTLQEWMLDGSGVPQYNRTLLQFLGLETNDATHAMDWIGFRPGAQGAERDYLYMSVGDGGIQANDFDFVNNPQDLESLRGKLLRLDVSGVDDYPNDDDRNYGFTPTVYDGDADNTDGIPGTTLPEIYYSGLRNPWRVSFDRATGDIYIGDVGSGKHEEINYIPGGVTGLEIDGVPAAPGDGAAVGIDFGWARREGFESGIWDGGQEQDPDGPGIRPESVDPLYAFTRDGDPESIRSITGGYVYRGPNQHPGIQGKYFWAGFDFPAPKLMVGEIDENGQLQIDVITDEVADSLPNGVDIDQITSFAEDAAGNLYFIDFGDSCSGCTAETGWSAVMTEFGTGQIFRINYVPDPLPGDYNGNGVVDAADYGVWLAALGGSELLNEAVTPGSVDQADYEFWKMHFGDTAPTAASTATPEPSAAILVLLGMLVAGCRRA